MIATKGLRHWLHVSLPTYSYRSFGEEWGDLSRHVPSFEAAYGDKKCGIRIGMLLLLITFIQSSFSLSMRAFLRFVLLPETRAEAEL